MYDKLKAIVDSLACVNVQASGTFRAFVLLRDVLVSKELDRDLACATACRVKIELPIDWSDEQLKGLICPFSECIVNLYTAVKDEGFSDDDFLHITQSLSLTSTG